MSHLFMITTELMVHMKRMLCELGGNDPSPTEVVILAVVMQQLAVSPKSQVVHAQGS